MYSYIFVPLGRTTFGTCGGMMCRRRDEDRDDEADQADVGGAERGDAGQASPVQRLQRELQQGATPQGAHAHALGRETLHLSGVL